MRGLEPIKGNIDSLLLCLIGQQPMYGYQIIKELEGRSAGYFKFKEGTLYPALHRLEEADLIRGKWELLTDGRQRKYYHTLRRRVLASYQRRETSGVSFWQP
jgi:DNA-binding PadR family transcriptional regulator